MLMRSLPVLVAMASVMILMILVKARKRKVLSWGWLGILMIFLPQAQGMFQPNGTLYVMFGLVSTFVGILLYTHDITRKSKPQPGETSSFRI
jgi:hypothetical protein